MKEEKDRLLRYIGEIYEKRRQDRIASGKEADKAVPHDEKHYDSLKESMAEAGKRIKKIRQAKKISSAKLSDMSGLTQLYIQEIEAGLADPYMTEIYDIAKALDIELSSLFEH